MTFQQEPVRECQALADPQVFAPAASADRRTSLLCPLPAELTLD